MKKYLLVISLTMIFALAGIAHADFYTWEDESGTMHITDYPPPQNQKKKDVKVYKGDPSSSQTSVTQDEQPSAKPEKKPAIMLFTKNDCPDCVKARDFLTSKKATFTEYNMDNDRTAAAKRKEIDDSSDVPFAVINRNQVYGFSENTYSRALKPPQ